MRRSKAENGLAALLAQPKPVLANAWLRAARELLESIGLGAAESAQLAFQLLGKTGLSQRDARREAERIARGAS